MNIHESVFIADSVILESPPISIGKDSEVWHYSYIRHNTKIGERTSIRQYCIIEPNCIIGNDVHIGQYTNITGGIIVEDKVFIGAGCIFSNDTKMVYLREKWISNPPIVRYGVRLGVGCVILPGIEIGRNSLVGAGSLVTKNIPDNVIVFGSPARIRGEVPHKDRL